MQRRSKPPRPSLDIRASYEVEDRRASVLGALEALRRAWPESAAMNVRARTVSELVRDLGMPLSDVREALARLDACGAIERAPRVRTHGGVPEVAWAAVDPRALRLQNFRKRASTHKKWRSQP